MSNVPSAENSITVDQVNKEAPPKMERFFKVIFGKDLPGKFMLLPLDIAPVMEPLTGQQVIIKDVEGCQWPVLLSGVDGDLAFTDGWASFFRHHNIKELSLLTFEYEGGSNSLFVRIYKDTGGEARSNKRAASSVQAPDAMSSHEGTRVSKTTSPSQFGPDSNEKLVDSDLETSLDEIIEADKLPSADNEVTSPVERCEFMEKLDSLEKHYGSETNVECIKNLGFRERARGTEIAEPNKSKGVKRKSDGLIEEAVLNSVGGQLDTHQQKRPALEQPMSEMGQAFPKFQAIDVRQSDNATPKYTELPILPSTVHEDHKQVLYLKDPKGRIWPFLNEDVDRRSVKLSTDKWKEFCDKNDINIEVDDCVFEVEQADLGVYDVRHVASRGSAA